MVPVEVEIALKEGDHRWRMSGVRMPSFSDAQPYVDEVLLREAIKDKFGDVFIIAERTEESGYFIHLNAGVFKVIYKFGEISFEAAHKYEG